MTASADAGSVALLVTDEVGLDQAPGTLFTPVILSAPQSVLGLEYVALRTASGGYLSLDALLTRVMVVAEVRACVGV